MKNMAILASGRGSNALELIKKAKELSQIRIKVLISDKADAGVLDHAKAHDIPHYVVQRKTLTQIEHEIEIIKILHNYKVSWIFLAGYMRILSPQFIRRFHDNNYRNSRIINIHPSLLPAYKGLNAFERAYQDQINESGITVHFVNEEVDGGQIIKQQRFKRYPEDTLSDFIQRGHKVEHTLYPQVLELLNNDTLSTQGHL
ncbi:MAG: phosphoribosylglycinamide formyltransferase [Halobacteriovoraceae bacterium]|nr:phosphoribosylglycinamide formyltransferase [Halobacteriovoraceae bacterium]|tara:strand:+ start:13009 stop:13611 length:603 start_codon:yes stop_codon:yes gene_type:complete